MPRFLTSQTEFFSYYPHAEVNFQTGLITCPLKEKLDEPFLHCRWLINNHVSVVIYRGAISSVYSPENLTTCNNCPITTKYNEQTNPTISPRYCFRYNID